MSSSFDRIVIDTNVLLSAALSPGSTSGKSYFAALDKATVLTSIKALLELREVLSRAKFNRYITPHQRKRFLEIYENRSKLYAVTHVIEECRDPRDNQFLELTLSAQADLILTGDSDLLVLHPWRGVSILTPAQYLATFS